MNGKVFQRGNTWTYVVDLPRKASGKRNQKKVGGFKSKREANAALAATINQINTGQYVEPSKIILKDFLSQWTEDSVKQQNKKSTASSYQYLLDSHVIQEIGAMPIDKIKPFHLQQLYRKKLESGKLNGKGGLSSTTVRRIHNVLHKAFSTAVKWQLLQVNPADAVDAPRQNKNEMSYLTRDQVEDFLEAAEDSSYKPLYLTAIMTGLRRGELLGLRWSDVDLATGQATIKQTIVKLHDGSLAVEMPKTKSSARTVAFSSSVTAALKDHKRAQAEHRLKLGESYENNNLIFASASGTPINPGNLYRHFKATLRKAQLPNIRFHDLRHTHATLMLEQGVHVKVVSERLGHSSIQITLDTYSHVLPNLQSDAAETLDQAIFGNSKPGEKVEESRALYSIKAAI